MDQSSDFDYDDDIGLYAITRKWGDKESLLYIGKTIDVFSKRLRKHKRKKVVNMRGIRFRVGYLELEDGKRMSKSKIKESENLLICILRPELNLRDLDTYDGRDLKIINKGKRGPLRKTVSSNLLKDWKII